MATTGSPCWQLASGSGSVLESLGVLAPMAAHDTGSGTRPAAAGWVWLGGRRWLLLGLTMRTATSPWGPFGMVRSVMSASDLLVGPDCAADKDATAANMTAAKSNAGRRCRWASENRVAPRSSPAARHDPVGRHHGSADQGGLWFR